MNTIPTREECLLLMQKQKMLPNIVRHSLTVEKVAGSLTRFLVQSGQVLNLAEISASALLHDITKTRSIHTHENHALTGGYLLTALGYPRIGDIISHHIEIPPQMLKGPIHAEEIVNYADKRVRHDSIVSLTERFQDLIYRYGRTAESRHKLKALEKQSHRIEKKVFSILKRSPENFFDFISDA